MRYSAPCMTPASHSIWLSFDVMLYRIVKHKPADLQFVCMYTEQNKITDIFIPSAKDIPLCLNNVHVYSLSDLSLSLSINPRYTRTGPYFLVLRHFLFPYHAKYRISRSSLSQKNPPESPEIPSPPAVFYEKNFISSFGLLSTLPRSFEKTVNVVTSTASSEIRILCIQWAVLCTKALCVYNSFMEIFPKEYLTWPDYLRPFH